MQEGAEVVCVRHVGRGCQGGRVQSAGRIRRGLCVQPPRLLFRLADTKHALAARLGAEIHLGEVIFALAGREGNWVEVAFGDEGLGHRDENVRHGPISAERGAGHPRTSSAKRATPPRGLDRALVHVPVQAVDGLDLEGDVTGEGVGGIAAAERSGVRNPHRLRGRKLIDLTRSLASR